MNTISINIGKKKLSSVTANVGILKLFLQFKKDFNEKKSFDSTSIEYLSQLLKIVFPTIKSDVIENMSLNDFINAANKISDWLALALKDAEKK